MPNSQRAVSSKPVQDFQGSLFHNRYLLQRKVFTSRYTEVWKAEDTGAQQRDRDVAIKMFTVTDDTKLSLVETIGNGYLSFSLRHGNLLLPSGFSIAAGKPYIVLPYQRNGSLRARIAAAPERPCLTERDLVTMTQHLADALAYLHRNGLVHQDVAPENIFPSSTDRFLLSDFGLSRTLHTMLMHEAGPNNMYHTAYASPQRFIQRAVEPPDDVFALGVVLFEAVSGCTPWDGAGGRALLDGSPIPNLGAMISQPFASMIHACLSMEPQDRPHAEDIATWATAYVVPSAAMMPVQDESATRTRSDHEARARREAEVRRRLDAEKRARMETEKQARLEAEKRARMETEKQARLEAESRVRLETEARQREESEEQARRESSVQTFLSSMSHAIRTPLQIISGYTQVVRESIGNDIGLELTMLFREIDGHNEQLLRTIEDVVFYANVKLGVIKPTVGIVRLDHLLEQLLAQYHHAAEEKEITLTLTNELGAIHVMGDCELLRRAVSEVIENAIDYTLKGEVRMSLKASEVGTVCVEVMDTGVGMRSSFVAQACEPFTREHRDGGTDNAHVGLGLAIAERCMDLHTGGLALQSTLDIGTRATLTFTDRVDSSIIRADCVPPTRAVVLVIEDHDATAEYMRLILGRTYSVLCAANAEEARLALATKSVDAICTDVSLGDEISGIDLTRELRTDPRFATLPIIAVTAHVSEENRRACLDAGCNDVLIKPFDRHKLLALLETHLAARRSMT